MIAANEGFVVAGYLVTAVGLGGYVWLLFARVRAARRQTEAIASTRR